MRQRHWKAVLQTNLNPWRCRSSTHLLKFRSFLSSGCGDGCGDQFYLLWTWILGAKLFQKTGSYTTWIWNKQVTVTEVIEDAKDSE